MIKTKYCVSKDRRTTDISQMAENKHANIHTQSQYIISPSSINKHSYIRKIDRKSEKNTKVRRRSRHIRNQEMRKSSAENCKETSIELKKHRNEIGIPSSHNPVKVTPSDIKTEVYDAPNVPRISHLNSVGPFEQSSNHFYKVFDSFINFYIANRNAL
jgi:hypothetical protein